MMAVTLAKDAVTLTRTHPNQWVWSYDPIPMGLALCLGSKGKRVEASGCKGKRVGIGHPAVCIGSGTAVYLGKSFMQRRVPLVPSLGVGRTKGAVGPVTGCETPILNVSGGEWRQVKTGSKGKRVEASGCKDPGMDPVGTWDGPCRKLGWTLG
jgi:hypothetical protein